MTTASTPVPRAAIRSAVLQQRLRERLQQAAARAREGTVPRLPDDAPVPLSLAQERMWFLEQLTPGTTAYLITFGIGLRGPLDAAALRSAVADLADRHESLRTCVRPTPDGVPE